MSNPEDGNTEILDFEGFPDEFNLEPPEGFEEFVQEDGCGYGYDHDEEIVYEDNEIIQWLCLECGAGGYSDKN